MTADRLFDLTMALGEGPVWDERHNTLYWVDIPEGRIWRHNFTDNASHHTDLGETVGMCCLTPAGDMVAALKHDIVLLKNGERTVLAGGLEADLPDNRFNDGKCDAAGRLLAGTMDTKGQQRRGKLYSLTQGQPVVTLEKDITCSNGLGWSPDNKTMYYIDTPSGYLWGYDYDLDTGAVTNRRPLIDYTKEQGSFDGMCVDSEGILWVAHWGGYCVSRWNPETGKKIGEVKVPAPCVTSCCFGGTNMDTLFITTARGGEKERTDYPLSGSLFAVKPGVTGPTANRFGGAAT